MLGIHVLKKKSNKRSWENFVRILIFLEGKGNSVSVPFVQENHRTPIFFI